MGNCTCWLNDNMIKTIRTALTCVYYSMAKTWCTSISFKYLILFHFDDLFSASACQGLCLQVSSLALHHLACITVIVQCPHSDSSMPPLTGGVMDNPWLACASRQGPRCLHRLMRYVHVYSQICYTLLSLHTS